MLNYLGIKIICVALILTISFPSKSETIDPFSILPFSLPKGISEIDKNYRTQWSRLSGFELSGLHWNQFVVVYTNSGSKTYNQNFFEYIKAIEADEEDEDYDTEYKKYSVGTVVLKENYLAGNGRPGEPISLTIMIKHKEGYSPDNGDWEYIESGVNGNILLRGKGDDPGVKQRCSECHKNIAERDYIFSTYYTGLVGSH